LKPKMTNGEKPQERGLLKLRLYVRGVIYSGYYKNQSVQKKSSNKDVKQTRPKGGRTGHKGNAESSIDRVPEYGGGPSRRAHGTAGQHQRACFGHRLRK